MSCTGWGWKAGHAGVQLAVLRATAAPADFGLFYFSATTLRSSSLADKFLILTVASYVNVMENEEDSCGEAWRKDQRTSDPPKRVRRKSVEID